MRAAKILATLFTFAAFEAAADTMVIHAGSLLAVADKPVREEVSIIIEDGKIAAVREGYLRPDGAIIVDLTDKFVLPGLIDSHVHILTELEPGYRLRGVTFSEADFAYNGALYAKRTLMAGFTTVADLGSRAGDTVFALRDAIAAGKIPGPRILAAGRAITPTGGHGDSHGYRADILHLMASEAVCDGVADCRRAVRLQVKRGADLIKITATGGVLSTTAAGTEQQFFDDEFKAIVETGHLLGKIVTAHAHGANGLNAALESGIDSIEHGTYLDRESIRLFKRTGAYLVPTIIAGETVADLANQPGFFPASVKEKAEQVGPTLLKAFSEAHEAGVKIAFGTDSGVSKHGDNAKEFLLMVKGGMTPREALISATISASDHLRIDDRVGTLEPGKLADIIAVDGNPLEDVSALLTVPFVMKEGTVYKHHD